MARWSMARVGTVLAVTFSAGPAWAMAEPLEKAARALEVMDYDRVLPLLDELDVATLQQDEQRRYWELLGTIHAIYGHDEQALDAFQRLLRLDPQFRPSPRASPKISRVLERARAAAPREAAPREAAPREAAPREAEPREAEPREAEPREAEPREAAPPPEPATDGPSGAVAAPSQAETASASPEGTPFWSRWYVWTAVGALVLGGVALGVAVTRDPYPPHDIGVIALEPPR